MDVNNAGFKIFNALDTFVRPQLNFCLFMGTL